MKRKILSLIALLLILAGFVSAQWKYNPFTGTFDKTGGSGTGDMLEATWATGGLIKVAKGGTGLATIAANSYLKGNDANALVPRTYAEVRTDLGLVIGTNVQEYDADLTTYAGITPTANAQSLLGQTYAQMLTSMLPFVKISDVIVNYGVDAHDNSAVTYTFKGADSTGAGHDGSKLILQGGLGGAGAAYGTVEIINSRLNMVDGTAALPAESFTSETTLGMFRPAAGTMGFGVSGSERLRFTAITSGGRVEILDAGALGGLAFSAAMGSPDVMLARDGANTLAQRNSTTQQIFRVYNTSDATGALTNYERLAVTGVAGTSLNITAETAGTGADNLDVIITPAGTGKVSIAGSGGAVSGTFGISDASGDVFTQTVGVMAAAQTLTWTPATNQIQMDLGTTTLIVSADCTLDQNLAIASTPTFAGIYKGLLVVNSGNNATVDLTAANTCKGQSYTNAGNDSDTHYDLPAAVVGYSVTFWVTDAFTVTVDPNGTDRIIGTSANGDYLQGAAVAGNMLALVCLKTGEWQTAGKVGTWTEE